MRRRARSAEEQHDFTQVVTLDLRLLAKLNAQPVGVLQERPQRSCVCVHYSAHPAAHLCVCACVRVQVSAHVCEECAKSVPQCGAAGHSAPTSGDENASVLSSGIRHLSSPGLLPRTIACRGVSTRSVLVSARSGRDSNHAAASAPQAAYCAPIALGCATLCWDSPRVHGWCKLYSRQQVPQRPYRSPHSRSSRLNSRETATT